MTRNQWIRKQKSVKPLLSYLRGQGYSVSFNDDPQGDWAYGWHSRATKQICVYLRKSNGQFWSLPDIVFVLAHEARHTEHIELGLFRKYYDSRRRYRAPELFLMALNAERNCDLSARKYLDKALASSIHKSSLYSRKYPAWRVSPLFLSARLYLQRLKNTNQAALSLAISSLTKKRYGGKIKMRIRL
jgi:hypothetical protein